jgi:hypothetical protein
MNFEYIELSAEQSVVMATALQSTDLTLGGCAFANIGTALVDELEARQSSDGSITWESNIPMDDDNLKRLLQLDVHLNLLTLRNSNLGLLPFSVKTNSLEYDHVSSSLPLHVDFPSLNVLCKKLYLCIDNETGIFPTEAALSLFRRVAELGHFEELKLTFTFDDSYDDDGRIISVPPCVVEAVIRAAFAIMSCIWGYFSRVKIPRKPCNLQLSVDLFCVYSDCEPLGPNYSFLRELLSHNRNITVSACFGRRRYR